MRTHDPLRIYSFISVLSVASIVTGLILLARVGFGGSESGDPEEEKSVQQRIEKLQISRDTFKRKADVLEKELELKNIELDKAKAELSRGSKTTDGANPM